MAQPWYIVVGTLESYGKFGTYFRLMGSAEVLKLRGAGDNVRFVGKNVDSVDGAWEIQREGARDDAGREKSKVQEKSKRDSQ